MAISGQPLCIAKLVRTNLCFLMLKLAFEPVFVLLEILLLGIGQLMIFSALITVTQPKFVQPSAKIRIFHVTPDCYIDHLGLV